MKTTHTPGPWNVDGSNITGPDDHNIGIVSGPHTIGASDAALESRMREHARDEANARLIAAAPDLLAALESLMQHFVGDRTAVNCLGGAGIAADVARAAIAKAKGAQ